MIFHFLKIDLNIIKIHRWLEKHVEFMLDDEYIERKELGEVEDKTVKFDLYMYHSANVSKDKG